MTPLEIARIQLDAEKAERTKIATSLRIMAGVGKGQGLSQATFEVIVQLAKAIENGDLSL